METKKKLKIRKRLRDSFRHNSFPRPIYCGYCGIKTKTEAHHFRYDPEDYVFICKKCHDNLTLRDGVSGQKGEKHHKSKITNEQAIEIFFSNLSYKELSNMYNISKTTISQIKNKRLWKHLWSGDNIKGV